ncbi:L-2-hydroxyglutarate oxidase [Rhodococcoides fascians]|uniref:L-2-hydroxyglutarate oxidase n=1 Tax=Rhodococcoides fascians TaxID=1828 RepID=UPI00050C5CB4|nr:L-2-hydroxyglutarate oxidase [Rhodococcus fascians]
MSSFENGKYDVVVVGAGIVGLAVAREMMIRRPDGRIAVIEKEDVVASHQTGHNSGVIHSGIYYTPGSLKARLCVEGSRLMYEFCEENDIPHERCGKLIVALDSKEIPGLDELERRGHANGVPDLRRVSADEIQEIEPAARGISALHSPNTGIVDYGQVSRAIEQDLRARGVEFVFGCEVTSVTKIGDETVIAHSHGETRADRAVFCAGLSSDKLATASGAPADPRILPFRGAYLHLAADGPPVVRGMIYPVPDPELPFLGVHVTKHIDGHVSLGPTAMLVGAREGYNPLKPRFRDVVDILSWPGTWRVASKFWKTGITEVKMASSRRVFVDACARYVPAVSDLRLEKKSGSGVRAQAVGRDGTLVDDFVISKANGASHVRNAPSPAATSAFALARELVDRVEASSSR